MENPDQQFELERLHLAVQDGNTDEVQRLIAANAPLDSFDDVGNTPLHYAVEHERIDIATLLLDAGADVNARDEPNIGNTPLASVAGRCSPAVAEFLINRGADPTIPGWMQLTALDRAAQRKRPEGRQVFDLLRRAAI